ncbi:MAG: DUF2092 domain-containing protein [Syntrophorhabdales bacterium]|jgi:hypothetical protein
MRTIVVCLILSLLAMSVTGLTWAEQPGQPEKAPAPMMEQRALDLLKDMSKTLAAAASFTYRSSSAVEVPAKTGQFITLFAISQVALERPNKLRVSVAGEIPNFEFYYNGTSVAAYASKTNVYSLAGAPGTIDAMLKFVEEKTEIHFPSADVMFSDPYAMMTEGLTSAFIVGPATVDGFPCQHLAFMAPGINWEIWIDTGKSPLPRRLVVTYTDVQNYPRFLVEFSDWNLKPRLTPALFAFKKPPNAKQIEFGAKHALTK